tara:strand:+ start:1111 stop:1683 length:573 start_codon:yes stop_codon:yes gene_type:complete
LFNPSGIAWVSDIASFNCVELLESFRVDTFGSYDEYSAGGVVVRWMEDAVHFLLILDPYGKWGLPKGHIESGENNRETAVREVIEETGLPGVILGQTLGKVDWSYLCDKTSKSKRKCCEYFLMSSVKGSLMPQRSEGIHDCRWVSVAEVFQVLDYDNVKIVIERAAEIVKSRNPGEIFEKDGCEDTEVGL